MATTVAAFGRGLSPRSFEDLVDRANEVNACGGYAAVLETWKDSPTYRDEEYGNVLYVLASSEEELDRQVEALLEPTYDFQRHV